MKRILVAIFAIWTFAMFGQNVDPETFPLYTGDVATKNVYSNTGGESKLSVNDIIRRSRNGVNGQDSSGLGGNLTQNTTINTSSYGLNISNLHDNTLLYTFGFNGCTKYIGTGAFTPSYAQQMYNSVQKDSCTGRIWTAIGLTDNSIYKRLGIDYNPSTLSNYFRVEIGNTTSGNAQDFASVDYGGGTLEHPQKCIVIIDRGYDYTGNLFEVNELGVNILKIKNGGTINIILPSYNDDADAIANGLVAGDVYQLSSSNTYGLPAGIHKTVQ